ncbi:MULTISPECIES: TniB family NTP-binding protein [unclassified Mesorhizobium]|uniref:TniB family NTP-binding protein n=1 Tax=unclassified Mesorhizobium TaxID=325217 RepID=UPI001FDF56B6|nr:MULTISPECIES: TniB family NTP-binding protein [unclassified Mesorhizobium]
MPSVAIYSDSGMDKAMIMKRFHDENPPNFNPGSAAPPGRAPCEELLIPSS